jgi:hypothetical protein
MPVNVRTIGRRGVHFIFAAALAIGGGATSFGAPMLRPDPKSPLATDGTRVYAVAVDRQTLIAAEPGKSEWSRVTTIDGAEIKGLAWAVGRLFFTNTADASVQSVATGGGDRVVAIHHRGSPFVRPTELTYSGQIVVADPGAGMLFRLPAGGRGSSGPSRPVPVNTGVKIMDETFVTGWVGGEVLISDGARGLLAHLTDLDRESTKYRSMQQRERGGSTVQWNQKADNPETLRRQGYPGVDSPGAIAVYNGIAYVIDTRSGGLFAAGTHDARAIKLPLPQQDLEMSRLVANSVWLTALDAKTGRVVRWPRVVPSEMTLLPGARPQSLFPVLEYLHRRKLLVTRALRTSGTVDDTLAQARMTWPARGEPAEPETRVGHYASFCMLNPQHCLRGLPRPGLPDGTPIVLADLYAERYTAATQVTLNGTQSLGAVVDAAIISDEFRAQRTEQYLQRVNGVRSDDGKVLREQTTGTYRISQELVRYVIPIEATELGPGNTEFSRLNERVSKTLRIAPLERVLTSAAALSASSAPGDSAAAHDSQHPNDAECVKAREALALLRQAIGYPQGAPAQSAPTRTIFVGVAEENFDPGHRDFSDPNGAVVLYVVGDESEPVAAPTPAPATDSEGVEPVTWRPFAKADHGTAVASLIAGRTRPYEEGGAFTRSLIGMFTHTEDATALAGDIERAFNWSPLTVVNLSLKAEREAAKMRTLMEDKRQMALFVIAAPNSASQVTLCEGNEVWYPACHGQVPENVNVLVVGGTTLKGDGIHSGSPVGKAVHIFAPAAGYYSAGRDNGYVPVEGTSFATALVSAAAAMLSSAGVTSPALIRQRLIATATVMEVQNRPQWARRLNIGRALSHFRDSVLVDASTKQAQPALLVNKSHVLTFKTAQGNDPLPVRLGDVRRLKRAETDPRRFELAYVTPGSPQLHLQLVRAPETPWNACYIPLDPQGQAAGTSKCVDLSELFDYVGPIE